MIEPYQVAAFGRSGGLESQKSCSVTHGAMKICRLKYQHCYTFSVICEEGEIIKLSQAFVLSERGG